MFYLTPSRRNHRSKTLIVQSTDVYWDNSGSCDAIYCNATLRNSGQLRTEAGHAHGHGEDDGGVLLGGDAGEGLEVAQLQRVGRLLDHLRRHLQRAAGLLLALSSDHLPGEPLEPNTNLRED